MGRGESASYKTVSKISCIVVKNPTKARLRKALSVYLSQNRLMTLAVVREKKPWTATVFFAYDAKLRFYFFSRPNTRHCTAIEKNPFVAVAINQMWRGKKKGIKGVQFAGRASRVSKAAYARAYALYRKRFAWAEEFKHDHILYKIVPGEIHYIDEEFFGHFFRVRIL